LKNYNAFYEEIYGILGDKTPLRTDCGVLCGKSCCKGDENTGMMLFPHEESTLKTIETERGALAVCDGLCNRHNRPLSCRIFPFFPLLGDDGKITVGIDMRAYRLCPLAENSDKIRFDKSFIKAVRKVGRLLQKDCECEEVLKKTTKEIKELEKLFGKSPTFSKRI